MEMIGLAITSTDPTRRAQILAEAQPQLAWALRSAVQECVESRQPMTQIAQRIGLPRETLHRQFEGGGPIVTVRAERAKPNPATDPEAREAIYAFQDEAGEWFGDLDLLDPGEFTTAMLPFAPANPDNRFGNQVLRVRFGPAKEDVTFSSAQVRLADGSERRVLVTYAVINLLFEDGQTPLRRALVQVIHAVLSNRAIPQEFRDLVHEADYGLVESAPEVGNMPSGAFIQAVRAIVEATDRFRDTLDIHSSLALGALERVVGDYERWSRAAR
jgi:hypothetical protein